MKKEKQSMTQNTPNDLYDFFRKHEKNMNNQNKGRNKQNNETMYSDHSQKLAFHKTPNLFNTSFPNNSFFKNAKYEMDQNNNFKKIFDIRRENTPKKDLSGSGLLQNPLFDDSKKNKLIIPIVKKKQPARREASRTKSKEPKQQNERGTSKPKRIPKRQKSARLKQMLANKQLKMKKKKRKEKIEKLFGKRTIMKWRKAAPKAKNRNKKKPIKFSRNPKINLFMKSRFERIRFHFNNNSDQIKKKFPFANLPKSLTYSFLEQCLKKDGNTVRLEMNRLEYMVNSVSPDHIRKFHKMNFLESLIPYLIFRMFGEMDEIKDFIFKLFSSYVKRNYRSFCSYKYLLAKNLDFFKMQKIFKKIVPQDCPELTQEFKFDFDRSRIRLVEYKAPGINRFSFYVDIFLLLVYTNAGIFYFIDDWRMLMYIFESLKKQQKFSLLKQFSKINSIKKINEKLNQTFGSSVVFSKFDFVQIIGEFEHIIFSKGLLDKLGIVPGGVDKAKPIVSQSVPEADCKIVDMRPQTPKQVITIGSSESDVESEAEKTRLDHIKTPDPGYLTKRPGISQKPVNYQMQFPTEKCHFLETFLKCSDTKSIVFYDFGSDLLKAKFDFGLIRVEELSPEDKMAIKQVVARLVGSESTRRVGKLIFEMVTSGSRSVKEYVRNLNLLQDFFLRVGEDNVPCSLRLGVIRVLYKMREMNGFLTKLFFGAKEDVQNQQKFQVISSLKKVKSYI